MVIYQQERKPEQCTPPLDPCLLLEMAPTAYMVCTPEHIPTYGKADIGNISKA